MAVGFVRRGLALGAVLVLGACDGGTRENSGASADDSSGSSGSIDQSGGDAACGDFDAEASDIGPVDCDAPHDAELAGTVARPDGADTDAAPDPVSVEACRGTAEALTGGPVWTTGLLVLPLSGTSAAAAESDRIECWVVAPVDGALVGSLRSVDPAEALGDLTSVFSIDVGGCFVTEADAFGYLTLVRPGSCDEVGAEQVTGRVPIDGDTFPGNTSVESLATEECGALFASVDFGVDVRYLAPLAAEWAMGQREFVCINVSSPAGGDAEEGFDYVEGTCFRNLADSRDPVGGVIACDEPHRWEYVGNVESPVETVPDEVRDSRRVFTAACADPVGQAAGVPITRPGLSLAFRVGGELGEPVIGSIACFAGAAGGDFLVSPLEGDFVAALGDARMIWTLEPGTCFGFLSDTFDIGVELACDADGALVFIGWFEAPDGPYPGEDELRTLRDERCIELLSGTNGVSADPSTVSGTLPSEPDWNNVDRRLVTCDARPG